MATRTRTVLTTRDIAAMAREHARGEGIPVGDRGRLSTDVIEDFLMHSPAKTVRELADGVDFDGIQTHKGRISKGDIHNFAAFLHGPRFYRDGVHH